MSSYSYGRKGFRPEYARFGLAVSTVFFSVAALAGCSSVADPNRTMRDAPSTTHSSSTEVDAANECRDFSTAGNDEESGRMTTLLRTVHLPAGTCFYHTQVREVPGQEGVRSNDRKIRITVILKVDAAQTPDDLRPAATDIAYTLREREYWGDRLVSLQVWDVKMKGYLIDEDFRAHAWERGASREADEAIWETHSD